MAPRQLPALLWAAALAGAPPAALATLATAPRRARRADEPVFAVEDDTFGEGSEAVHLKVLLNRATGERLEVAWNLGGRTGALRLRSPSGRLREVLMHSGRNATDAWRNVGWKGAMLAPFANRVRNGTYKFNRETLYLQRNEDRGRYGKNSLHGYLYRKEMRVLHASADNHSAVVTLAHSFDGTDPGYPFPLDMSLTYTLDAAGFTLTTRAVHREPRGQALPFFSSWHSYFAVEDVSRAVLELDRCSRWNHILVTNNSNVYSDLIPTGVTEPFTLFDGRTPIGGTTQAPTYYDDEFKATAPAEACTRIETRIKDPVAGETTVLWGDRQFRWVQVYTGTVKDCGAQAIAVEAMSGEADSWNNQEGIRLLQAGESWEGSFGVQLEHDWPYPMTASLDGALDGTSAPARGPKGFV